MTEQEIMAVSHGDMVQLCLLRYDEVKTAMRETFSERLKAHQREYFRKRYADDPEFRERRKETTKRASKKYADKNREKRRESVRKWRERHPEYYSKYKKECRQKIREEMAAAALAESELKPEAPASVFEPKEPKSMTDPEKYAYWQGVVDDLEYRFHNREIDVETYFGKRSAAMSHLQAAEARMRPYERKRIN